MVRFKASISIIEELRKSGYSTYRIRKERIMAESTLQKCREGTVPSLDCLNRLCELMDCQPGDLIEYVRDGE